MKQLTLRDYPHFVGFDRLFNELDRVTSTTSSSTGYPPYNVISENENDFIVEVAVAGFTQEQLSVEEHDGQLTIKGSKDQFGGDAIDKLAKEQKDKKYLHKGISDRNFERSFTLAEHVHVDSAKVENGLLTIKLIREVPKELQPRKIAIEYKK